MTNTVDLDVFNGTKEEFRLWIGLDKPVIEPPPPDPEPIPEPIPSCDSEVNEALDSVIVFAKSQKR